MTALHLDNRTARRLILHLQGLTDPPHRALPPGGLYDLIHRLGYVQVDAIPTVERAHHMILFARNQTYRPDHLHKLIERDKVLFENWTHDASIIPAEFYPYWRHRFARIRPRLDEKFGNWQGSGFRDHIDTLKQRIETEGALMSRDLERPDTGPREMWQWHDGKAALEYLWRTGELCISERRNFQKVYDLAHRHIPREHHDADVSHHAFIDFACRAALDRLGIGAPGDIARFFDLVSPAEVRAWCAEQAASNRNDKPVPVTVQGVDGKPRPLLARADIEDVLAAMPEPPARLRALSPFDPVIRDRKRLEWLFGFEYRIEIYVPAEKRRWGYYVFPLLEGDRLTGRIDMSANRATDRLEVKRLWWEDKVKPGSARMGRLEAELTRQCRLAGVSNHEYLDHALEG